MWDKLAGIEKRYEELAQQMAGPHVRRDVYQRPRHQLAGAACWIYLGGVILLALLGFAACGWAESGDQAAQDLRLSLQVPSPVRAGETVPLTLIAKNVSDGPVELGLGGTEDTGFAGSYDFVVSTPDGVQAWSFADDKAFPAILSLKTLDPGEELILEGEWKQADAQGTPIAAGSYAVRGFLNIRLDVSTPRERELRLETEAKPLLIVPE